jgi:hypothetical protein
VDTFELPPDTVLWWRQRQIDVAPELDLARMRAMVAESRERERRFVALFRPPTSRRG